ncbi:acetoacetate--CoA ligase [Comamonas thiooxydans]|uniref:Acetoacetyl-CoA synthetase n=1 Tax=Comamonas thiooxydans TaxID=363952 RepID=A0A0E3BY49_9BURK|nr:acetoacetate--CoA ligase [Comamonas thiooxydans]KGG81539.1 acetoacetyl-CoA synthetase [Comamonas thiooxydans]KGH12093.1 acetoacetyl-CoA synthetase [Comamonas thiooxydans]KGH18316.1 acetoacetyl-CoA synthetase [Comamonas thiooxydans]KGH22176.1 acetoacetyl-CoA synthetase [Comamonas thiooxydans]
MALVQGQELWRPTQQQQEQSGLWHYMDWLRDSSGRDFSDYEALWQWSATDIEGFWRSVWDYFDIQADGDPTQVLAGRKMPGAEWFPETRLNYAEHIFRQASDQRPAIIARCEGQTPVEVSWQQLQRDVGALAASLRGLGIVRGDRVVAYLPNVPQTVVAFLACASIGAIWSSCAPEMGVSVVLDRFQQIAPKLIFATDSYSYAGRQFDRREVLDEVLQGLPDIARVIHVPGPLFGSDAEHAAVPWRDCMSWADATCHAAPLQFERLPFSHPLWVVYSSGTTGLPKAMVHSHGGIVLTHLKTNRLQHDVLPGDRFMFLGSTGWIVWNLMIGSLLAGATVVLSDGNPTAPSDDALWDFIDQYQVSIFGCGAAFLTKSMKDGVSPKKGRQFEKLRAINSTGSPLPLDAYAWVYENVKRDLWLASISGGTDIASGFVACAPILPVNAGEIQCRELGVAAHAFNEQGQKVIAEVGELVITEPMPSMPVFFWNDESGARYHDSYFDVFAGCWRHGDWIEFSERGTAVIYGRSDSTINRFGIRMGTAEIYRVVEELDAVKDSLVVDLEYLGRPSFMPLFVTLAEGQALTGELTAQIKNAIKTKASARHVPNVVVQVAEIPRTLTGKKMEVPVRKLLLGADAAKVASPDAMANPSSIDFFIQFREQVPQA